MAAYNLKCPKGYGEITFVVWKSGRPYCPLAGERVHDCTECKVMAFNELDKDKQVRSK